MYVPVELPAGYTHGELSGPPPGPQAYPQPAQAAAPLTAMPASYPPASHQPQLTLKPPPTYTLAVPPAAQPFPVQPYAYAPQPIAAYSYPAQPYSSQPYYHQLVPAVPPLPTRPHPIPPAIAAQPPMPHHHHQPLLLQGFPGAAAAPPPPVAASAPPYDPAYTARGPTWAVDTGYVPAGAMPPPHKVVYVTNMHAFPQLGYRRRIGRMKADKGNCAKCGSRKRGFGTGYCINKDCRMRSTQPSDAGSMPPAAATQQCVEVGVGV